MKRWFLAAVTAVSLAAGSVQADDCQPPVYTTPCIADAYGNTVCATRPDMACMIDGNGNAVCGYNCQVGPNGVGFCPG